MVKIQSFIEYLIVYKKVRSFWLPNALDSNASATLKALLIEQTINGTNKGKRFFIWFINPLVCISYPLLCCASCIFPASWAIVGTNLKANEKENAYS